MDTEEETTHSSANPQLLASEDITIQHWRIGYTTQRGSEGTRAPLFKDEEKGGSKGGGPG
jgi:hypothetical protein